MHVLAISNRKGGTGKTTVSVNLAAALAQSGWRVLLIDLDSQGHCAVGLGLKTDAPQQASVHDLFTSAQARLCDAIVPSALPTLWLAPANPRFDHGEGERDDTRLRRAIADEGLTQRFDLIVIDTPPSMDALLMNALLAATRVLVPYVPHPLSFEGLRQLVRALFPIMTRHNRGLKLLGFLPTMAADHIRQHRDTSGRVSSEFGAERGLPAIRSDIRLAEAFGAGAPVCLYAPRCRGAEDFAALALRVRDLLRAG